MTTLPTAGDVIVVVDVEIVKLEVSVVDMAEMSVVDMVEVSVI